MQTLLNAFTLSFLLLLCLPGFAQECNNHATKTTDHLTDNNNGTVTDLKTGLIWKKCSEGQYYNSGTNRCDDSTKSFTWEATLQQAQAVNAGTIGEAFGKNDWHVPNINELASIIELSCHDPAINNTVFPDTPSSFYWSSSPYAGDNSFAWLLRFRRGNDGAYDKGNPYYVRLVRSIQ